MQYIQNIFVSYFPLFIFWLPDHFRHFQQDFFPIARHKEIKEIRQGFRIKGTVPSARYNRMFFCSVLTEKRNPRKIQHIHNIWERKLILQCKSENIHLISRLLVLDGKYDFVILDDGLFDDSIIKDVNVVVFDSNFFIGNGYVLPAGPLRTRFKTLAKADFVILTDVKDEATRNQINMLSVYIDPSKILQAKLKVKSQHSKTEKYIAFSGIGENQKFFDTLKREGLNVVCEVEFEDHVWYDQKNIDILTTKFKELKATKFITTSKDYVKLPEEFRENVEVLEIGYEIPGLEAIFKTS